MARTVLYLHGFLSSPLSYKARVTEEEARRRGWNAVIPDLSVVPDEIPGLLESAVAGAPPGELSVIGSSLGGYYAAWLAALLDIPAVLVNPAVRPWEVVMENLGEQVVPATGKTVFIDESCSAGLLKLQAGAFRRPERVLALLCTGDEVLDWRDGRERFSGSPQLIIEGNDHAVGNFEQYVRPVFDFLENGTLPPGTVPPA